MSTVLDRIVAYKARQVAEARLRVSEAELKQKAKLVEPPRDFRGALERGPAVAVIAEIKKASPSAGVIRPDFDPAAIAHVYQRHGASCISVLTDEPSFQGQLHHLQVVRGTVALPLLRKDFLLDPYQLLEARAAGADAVLLIAEVLAGQALAEMLEATHNMGMQALVELYDAANVKRVLDCGARLIGVNNRDLRTFQVRLEHTLEIARDLPADVCLVSESGIRNRGDIERLKGAGVQAVLVGETLMRAADPGAKLAELLGRPSI
jgi:indole-3-glycerol phosphate synthase